MKSLSFSPLWLLTIIAFGLAGCCRSTDDMMDDTRTAGRHISRGFRSLGGKHGDSRQVCCREDFLSYQDTYRIEDFQSMEFEPLPDHCYFQESLINESPINTVKNPTSQDACFSNQIPGIEGFKDPNFDPLLSQSFRNIQFAYNSCLIKGKDNLGAIHAAADYMKQHPSTYLFIEGHCDERGAEAFNLALGAQRSNAVRNMLINEGVSPERIFTVSYGKERPLDSGHNEDAWAKNRRAQFKIYKG